MSFTLRCCPGCNKWRKYEQYEGHHECACGYETFTEEWILKHPEHPAYQKYLEFLKGKDDVYGKNLK